MHSRALFYSGDHRSFSELNESSLAAQQQVLLEQMRLQRLQQSVAASPQLSAMSLSGGMTPHQLYSSASALPSTHQQASMNQHMQRLFLEQQQLRLLQQSLGQSSGFPGSERGGMSAEGGLSSSFLHTGLPRSIQMNPASSLLGSLHPGSDSDRALHSLSSISRIPTDNPALRLGGAPQISTPTLLEGAASSHINPFGTGAAFGSAGLNQTILAREELRRRLASQQQARSDDLLLYHERAALLAAGAYTGAPRNVGTFGGQMAYPTSIARFSGVLDGHSASQSAAGTRGESFQGTTSNEPVLPVILAVPGDRLRLSSHQCLLRRQIQVFKATDDDLSTHTRGRNKPIMLGQVGIRCRHCAHLPVALRKKGSTYFPATLMGLYQAAQNMSTTHMQGACTEMSSSLKEELSSLVTTKVASSTGGRPYWANSAASLGLVDTSDGIRFVRDVAPEHMGRTF
jgi:hypothetical protein